MTTLSRIRLTTLPVGRVSSLEYCGSMNKTGSTGYCGSKSNLDNMGRMGTNHPRGLKQTFLFIGIGAISSARENVLWNGILGISSAM